MNGTYFNRGTNQLSPNGFIPSNSYKVPYLLKGKSFTIRLCTKPSWNAIYKYTYDINVYTTPKHNNANARFKSFCASGKGEHAD